MAAFTAAPLVTRRLWLEPLREEHAELLLPVLSDPRLHAFIGGRPDTLAELRARYRRMLAGAPDPRVSWCNWAARWRADGQPVATLQATISQAATPCTGEIAYLVGTAWQGRGIAREMGSALIGWLAAGGVGRVIAHIHPEHAASAAVATALGLRPTPVRVDGEVEWELAVTGGAAASPPAGRC